MKITEFAQKNGMVFFCTTIILVIVIAVGAGMMFLHKGPRSFGGMRSGQGGAMMQGNRMPMGGYGRQPQGGTQAPVAPTDGTTSAAPTAPADENN